MAIRPAHVNWQLPLRRSGGTRWRWRRIGFLKDALAPSPPVANRRRAACSRYRLAIECLEDRTLFSVSPVPVPLVFDGLNAAHVSHFLSTPNEVDLYSVTLGIAEELTASVNAQREGSGLASVLRVFDAAGTPLALEDPEGGDPQLTFQATTAGVYYLGVSSAPDDAYALTGPPEDVAGATTGLYALNVQLTNSPVLLPDLAGSSFRLGADMAAAGDAVPVSFTVDNRGGGAAGNFQVQVVLEASTPFDGAAQVLAILPRAELVPDASGRSFSAPPGFSVTLPAGLTSGPADIGLRIVADPAVPEYDLGVNAGAHGGADFEAVTVVTLAPAGVTDLSQIDAGLNAEVTGNLASADRTDAYPFTVTTAQGAGQFTAEVTGLGGLLPRLTLLDGQGNLLIDSDSGQIVQQLLPGTYSLIVSAQAGAYRLDTAFMAANVPNADLAGGANTFSVAMGDLNGDGIPDLVEVNRGANTVSVFLGVGAGAFEAPVSYPVGYFPWSVAIADLTPNGIPDLIVVNKGDGTVSVLLGNGDGTFQPQATYPVGARPGGITVGDFSGDGIPDLAVSNYGDGTVSVLLGNGNGTFQPQIAYPVGYGPGPVQTADVNGDGIPDLITPNYLSGTVSVLLGQADGSFQAAESIPITGGSPYAVAIGDVNGDGKPDLVVANLTTNDLSVLLGNGQGGFALQPQTYAAGSEPYSVALADLNGDGKLDILTADYSSNSVSVLLGDGDGTFAPKTDFPVGKSPRNAIVGDVNGDGKPDIVTANNSGDSVTVLLGDGDGSFSPRAALPPGPRPSSVAIADLTNDGLSDLVVANRNDGDVSVLLQNADGTFQTRETYPAGPSPNSVAVADLNGDGIPDIVTANYAYKGSVSVLLGNGDGTFQPPQSYPAGHSVYALAVGDLRGNGIDDLVAVNKGDSTVSVFLGNGDGTFQPQQVYDVGAGGNPVTLGDCNGDGIPDIVVANFAGNTVSVLLGNGDGTFQPQTVYAVGRRPSSVAIGDVNGDGIPDLVVADYGDNGVSVLLGQRGGGFAPPRFFPAGNTPNSVALADFTGDGDLDVVTANVVGNDATVLLGNGDGTFQAPIHLPAGTGAVALAVGRLDRDGHLDLAIANETDGTISLIDGTGDGSFRPQQVLTAGKNIYAVAVADVNGDGSPDLITTSVLNDTVSVSLGNGDGAFAAPLEPDATVGAQPTAAAAADLNGDGRLDLVTANSYDNTVSVLLGNGDGTFQPASSRETFAVGRSPRDVVIADLTGDGSADIVTTNYNDGTVSVLLGRGDGTFQPQRVFAVGERPYSLTVSDVNGDGIPDLIVANAGSDTVSVLLGNGDGTFRPQETFAVGRQPFSVTVADLAGNGVPDLIAANAADNTVSVLMGLGGGRFAPQQVFAAGAQPFSVAAGDLTGDGHVDVVTADNAGNSVGVLLGNGLGGFAPLQLVAANQLPTMLTLADVNGDGRPDLITVGNHDNATSVLLNTGGGAFAPANAATDVALQDTPIFADVDRDGIPDEIVLDRSGNILFRKGLAGGAFAPPQILNPGEPARDITLVSVGAGLAIAAADAHFDPALSGGQDVFPISLYSLGAGDAVERATAFATPALPARIAAADLTGDGLDDLVTANALDDSVSIALQTAPGVFADPITVGVGIAPSDIAFADVNHDDFLSVIVTDQASGDITVILNDASHAFSQTLRFRAGAGAYGVAASPSGGPPVVSSLEQSVSMVAGKFTGSGQTDLVVVNRGEHNLTLLAADGSGGFANPSPAFTATISDPASTDDQPGAVVAGDFNRDGKLDLAVLMTVNVFSAQTNSWTPTGQVWIYTGNDDGTFQHLFTIAVGDEATGLTVIPGNGTGLLDLLVGNGFGDVLRLQGNGDGTFQISGKSVSLSVVPDLFGAGQPGVLVGNQQQDRVTVQAPGAGGGSFATVATLGGSAQLAPGAVQWAVLDKNATLADAVVLSTGSNAVIVYRTLAIIGGAPVFAPDPQTYFVGTAPTGITIADISGDGIPDMLITNQGSNDVSVLFGTYDASGDWIGAVGPRLHSGGAGPIAVTVSSLPGDANPDLIVTNGGSGTETVLPGVGQGFFNDQAPETLFQFGASVIQAPTYVGATGVGYALTDAGDLLRFDLEDPAAGASLAFDEEDVVAAQAQADGDVVVALADGDVKVLQPAGDRLVVAAELQAQSGTALSPSALVVLQKSGGQLEVLVSSQGSDTIFTYGSAAGARAEPPSENAASSNGLVSALEFSFPTLSNLANALGASEGAASAGGGVANVAAAAPASPSVATLTSYDNLAVVADASAVLVPVQGNAYSTVPVLGLGPSSTAERSDGAARNPALSLGRPLGDASALTRFLIGQDDALNQHRDSTGTRLSEPGRGAAHDPWRADLFFRVRPWQPPAVAPMDENEADHGLAAAEFWGDDILERPREPAHNRPDLGVAALLLAAGLLGAAPLIAGRTSRSSPHE